MERFRSDGLRSLGNHISVPIQTDDDGYLGRECPNEACEEYFKITPGTGIKGPAPCHCPYCGHEGDSNTFWTKEQLEYVKSEAMDQIMKAVRHDLKALEFDHKPGGPFGIGISTKLEPGAPVPVRWYREKNLETEIVCDQCTLRYAIYGVFGWCPDCGVHNLIQILTKNLDLARRKLALVTSVEQELSETLIADALAGVVSAFDGFGRELCTQCDKPSFQNLEGARKRVQQGYGFDMVDCLTETEWLSACRGFQKRHLIAHKMGVVDQDYILKVSDSAAVVGRKVTLTTDEVASLVDIVERLGKRLYGGVVGLPASPQTDNAEESQPVPLVANQPSVLKFAGLIEADALVFEHACKIAVEQGHCVVISGERLVPELSPKGISEQQIMDAEEVLENRGYIKIHGVLGPPHAFDFAITHYGFDQFARIGIPNLKGLCAEVERIIVRDPHTNNNAVAQELDQSITVVEHIFASMQSNGLIKYDESIGGGLQMDIYWTSPELRRKVQGQR
jgi:hypothetical protein